MERGSPPLPGASTSTSVVTQSPNGVIPHRLIREGTLYPPSVVILSLPRVSHAQSRLPIRYQVVVSPCPRGVPHTAPPDGPKAVQQATLSARYLPLWTQNPVPAPVSPLQEGRQLSVSNFFERREPLAGSPPVRIPSDDEWGLTPHARWLHLGRHCAFMARPWFQDSLAEDWVRLAYLAPMCGAPVTHPATQTHSLGPTKISLLRAIPAWQQLRCLLLEATDAEKRSPGFLAGKLLSVYESTLSSIPHIVNHPRFWAQVARHIESYHGPGGKRTGTTASWSEQGGFTLFPPAGGWGHGKQVPL
jgi:hypothetical protein